MFPGGQGQTRTLGCSACPGRSPGEGSSDHSSLTQGTTCRGDRTGPGSLGTLDVRVALPHPLTEAPRCLTLAPLGPSEGDAALSGPEVGWRAPRYSRPVPGVGTPSLEMQKTHNLIVGGSLEGCLVMRHVRVGGDVGLGRGECSQVPSAPRQSLCR